MKKLTVSFFVLTLLLFVSIKSYAFLKLGSSSVDVTYTDATNDFKNIRSDMVVTSNDGSYTIKSVKTITDAGRFKNHADIVKISKKYNFDLNTLYNEGYKTAAIEIKMDIKEISDGYQHIFIYNNVDNGTRLLGATFEHGSGITNDNDEKYCFYLELNLKDILDGDFVIRYDASGKGNDDWQNDNVEYQLGFSKDSRKTDYIWTTKGSINGTVTWERLNKKS